METVAELRSFAGARKADMRRRTLEAINRGKQALEMPTLPAEARQALTSIGREMEVLERQAEQEMEHIVETPISVAEEAVPAVPSVPEQAASEAQEQREQVDPALERLNRDLELAETVTKLEQGGELTEQERRQLAGMLEHRGWHKLFNQVRPGQAVIATLAPSGDAFSIKNFNDNLFGMQRTDDIIIERRNILSNSLKEAGLEELSQSFKDGYFTLPADQVDTEEKRRAVMERLAGVMTKANADITAFIASVAEREAAMPGNARREALRAFQEELKTSGGYRGSFGMALAGEAAGEGDYTYIEKAVGDALKGAKLGREHPSYGQEFTAASPERILEFARELREALSEKKEIVDANGRSFVIFEMLADGTKQLNLDVIRDVRKGKFKPLNADQAETLRDIRDYMERINILDVLKPYTHEELSGSPVYGTDETLSVQVTETNTLVDKLRAGGALVPEDRERIAGRIKQEGKDRTCTSSIEFHSRALDIPNCTYLNMDVLDVGPKLLQEFDRLLQQVERGDMSFAEASLIAGDETTRNMREFRAKITEAYRNLTGGETPLMLVGGDEAAIAMDSSLVDDAFLMELRRATNSRVVETVVAGSERRSSGDDTQIRREHLAAQKLAEQGSELAKNIESGVRNLRLAIADLPSEEQAPFLAQVNGLNIRQFAVKQRKEAQGFDLIVEDPANPRATMTVDADRVLASIDDLRRIVSQAVGERRAALLAELSPRYPNIDASNIARVIRMKNMSAPEEYQAFLDAMK